MYFTEHPSQSTEDFLLISESLRQRVSTPSSPPTMSTREIRVTLVDDITSEFTWNLGTGTLYEGYEM